MIKDFKDKVVLTTQEPGAFLNFRWDGTDTSVYLYVDPSIEKEIIYSNGMDLGDPSEGYALHLTEDISIASFYLFTRKLEDFEYNLKIDTTIETIDISVLNRPFFVDSGEINTYETSKVQLDDETSYLVLRTNPKFTGNVKLIIDSSNHLYLDTFKISDILNNRKYRKQKVSANSVISNDIRRVFSTLPEGELYKLDNEDTLNISIPKTEFKNQYNLTYSYGARHLNDDLYKEKFSILAPIWINKQLPDYFVAFRLSGAFNSETYNNSDLSDLLLKYLEEGEIVKSWGIKEETALGTYLRSHNKELLNIRSPLFLSLSDPYVLRDPDPNTWYGIAVDKGIITGRSETPYFFDQKETFTEINAFVSSGFERLNLLCPNLINMEYTFDDDETTLYSMNRYFGLYLTENELYKISYYAHDEDDDIELISLDNKDSSIFINSSLFDEDGNIDEKYKNRLFTINDIHKIKRITNIKDIDGTDKENIEEWINKPHENIFNASVKNVSFNKFITLKLNNTLNQGEHLRIIDKTQFKIWEIYSIESELLNPGESWTYASTFEHTSGNCPTIYRTCFSTRGSILDQMEAMNNAFNVFSDYPETPFEISLFKKTKGEITLKVKDSVNANDIWFQRITAQTVNDPLDEESEFNEVGNYNDLSFYDRFNPTIEDFERLSFDASYGPINFELYGDRMSLMVKLIDQDSNYFYSFNSKVKNDIIEYTMYLGEDKRYRIISDFNIETSKSSHSYNYILDPSSNEDNLMISTTNKILTIKNNIWNAYSVYPLTISLMGINPVKDMDYTVYDSSIQFESEYRYKREDDSSTYFITVATDSSLHLDFRNTFEIIKGQGSISINEHISSFNTSLANPFYFNTFEGDAIITNEGNSMIEITYNQLSGDTHEYTSYDSAKSEESLDDYYINPKIKAKLKWGLTVPYISKWVTSGSDCRNNPFKLMLNDSMFDDASSNFITFKDPDPSIDDTYFQGEISYPSYKYLSPQERAWKEYIYYDINDVLRYKENGETKYSTIKNFMLSNPYKDVFSKMIYTNHNTKNITSRSSITYYNKYKRSIDTILKGLNLSLTVDQSARNLLDVQDWDRYRISFISTASRNRDNNNSIEVIINENTGTILIIWYQGSDILNYNARYSDYFPGKGVLDTSIGSAMEFSSFKTGDPYWSHIKTPFVVNNSTIDPGIFNLFNHPNVTDYDASICSPYSQLNWNTTTAIYSIFNSYLQNDVLNRRFRFFGNQYNTFRKYIDYNYSYYSLAFGTSVINYGYSYMNNTNFYEDKTNNLEILEKIIENNNNIGYYIIKEERILRNINFIFVPIRIRINSPRKYKNIYTYNGWYKPKFIDMFNFNYNEDINVIETLEKDFIYSNTNVNEYSNIPQLWYNKVVDNVTQEHVDEKNAIGYIRDFNIFKAQWDNDYYVLSNDVDELVAGYESSMELPSFFGSKLTNLPDKLILDKWSNANTSLSEGENWHTLEYNLTRKIVNIFSSAGRFINNWVGLGVSSNIINDYIQDTILKYYNINVEKTKIELYSKPYDGKRLAFTLDDTFELNESINIDANISFINNEHIYNLRVPLRPNLTYFVKFILFEK